jgi:hypothetical protein
MGQETSTVVAGVTKVDLTRVSGATIGVGNPVPVNVVAGGGGGPVTIADGADVAEGSTGDAAWVSGAGTVIALLKKIASAGGSAVSIADGADVTEGALADAAVVTDSNGTLSGKIRGLVKILADVWDSINHRLKVDGSGVTQPVSGAFFQATQPVSAVALPLPANAAQETGGNLDVLTALTKQMLQLSELQREQVAILKAIQLQQAAAFGMGLVDSQQLMDSIVIH